MRSCHDQTNADRPTSRAALQARLRAATGELSFRQVAEVVGCHPESARRWLTTDNRPPLWFIVCLCDSLRLNPHWAMTGAGPMHLEEARAEDLAAASPRLLLERLAELMGGLVSFGEFAAPPLPLEPHLLRPSKRRATDGGPGKQTNRRLQEGTAAPAGG